MVAVKHQHPMHKNLTDYQKSLERSYLSKNTVRVYLKSVYTYYNIYKELTAKTLDGYKEYLETHYCPRSANLHIIGINRYLKYLGKSGMKLPSIRIRQKNYLDDVISFQDYQKLKRLLKSNDELKWYYIVWTLAATGVRVSELVQLQVAHVSKGYVDIRSKGNKIRRIYFPKKLQTELLNWINSRKTPVEALFLNDRHQAISIRGVSKGLERMAIKFGFDKHLVHPHAFRHLFAKKFLEARSDLSMLADLLGHESLDTTKIYLRMSSQEQQKIIDDVVKW